MTTPANPAHRFTFHRVGGLDQVALRTAEDLRNLEFLDQKLWVALSCPVKGLELDQRTLELLDLDQDGRVRAPEIVTAIRWTAVRLKDLGAIRAGAPALPLSAIEEGTPEGKALLGAARQVLASLGRPEATEVTPADVKDLSHVFEKTVFNGDGVVPPEAADDPAARQAILDAMACVAAQVDRSGKPGIDQTRLDAFFAELAAFADWHASGQGPGVQPFGAGSAAAYEAVQAVKPKVDDYFTRCRLAAMDPRGAALLNRTELELQALAARDLSGAGAEVAAFPIARAEAGRALPLEVGVNPAWAAALASLQKTAVTAAWSASKTSLAVDEWAGLQAALAPYAAWQAVKKGAAVEKLGAARVQVLLAAGKGPVEVLIARDKAMEAEANAVADVARMVHYHRDLSLLLRNFVAFTDFYDARQPAIFQAGTLYLDARSTHLCIRVDDPAAHAALGSLSHLYLAYCECKRPSGEKMRIAACFTQGDSDYLMVGRNGLFYDRQGRDWDATIVKIVDSPISIRQAFFSPYKKFLRMVEDSIARFAASREKEVDARLAKHAEATGAAATAMPPPAKVEPVDVGKMVGIIAALGVGLGALGTLLGALVAGFVGLQPWWAKLVALGAMVAVVSGPSMLIAGLKLRQRTLGPVLDANGWAVNGRVRVNFMLGKVLTDRAVLPPGASRTLEDPFEDPATRTRRRVAWLLLAVVAAGLGWARWAGRWPFGPWSW